MFRILKWLWDKISNVPSSPYGPTPGSPAYSGDDSFDGVDGYPHTEDADGVFAWASGDRAANRANAFTAASQEDSQAFERQMMYESAGLQQKFHQDNLLNDPILTAQGLKGAGLSDAAVAQALTGSVPNGFAPTISPHGSGSAQGAYPETPALAQAMMQLPLQVAQAKLFNSQAAFTDTQNDMFPKVTNQQIQESVARIRQKDKELGILEADTNAKIALNKAYEGKTLQEIKVLDKQMSVYDSQIARWAHQNKLDDVNSFKAFNEAILAYKKGRVADAEVGKVHAETEKAYSESYKAQAEGYVSYTEGAKNLQETALAWEQTDLARMENEMFDMKLQIAQQVGMPIQSDEVGEIFMAMCTGNYAAMAKSVFTTQSEFCNFGQVASTPLKRYPKASVKEREDRNPWTNVSN